MTAQEQASLPYESFTRELARLHDRLALLQVKAALQEKIRDIRESSLAPAAMTAAVNRHTRKMIHVDGLLSRFKSEGKSGTGATIISLRVVDEDDDTELTVQYATMRKLPEFMAWAHQNSAEFGNRPPAYLGHFIQPDLTAIHPDVHWDDTRPSDQEMVDIPHDTEPLHEYFSR